MSEEAMLEDQQLLRQYAADGSEAAFGELVARYVNLVYSAALRRTGGDTHLAQDAAQLVFSDLARKARSLPKGVVLTGWLHRATSYSTAQLLRTERRRQAREQEAIAMNALESEPPPDWAQLRPLLDDVLDRLAPTDRDALLLRFFEQRSLTDVGRALGSNEDAARKRVTRALDKLRAHLVRRGITTPAAALASAIAAHAVQTAPAGLAATLTTASLAGAAGGTGAAVGLLKLMAMTKLKLGLAGAVAVASVATPLVIQHQAVVRLREENRSLQQQADQAAEQRAENERLSRMVAQANAAHAPTNNQLSELLRLRGEVGLLRGQSNELARLREENRRLRAGLIAGQGAKAAKPPPEVSPEDIFPKESWAFAGYATPEATLQTFHWATVRGDVKTVASCRAPPAEQALTQAHMQKEFEGKSESEIATLLESRTSSLLGFRILARTNLPNGQAAVTYYYDGAGIVRGMRLEKVGNEWKIAPGQN
jgi:RNA polymerase sigma factor (sigma-70 family)